MAAVSDLASHEIEILQWVLAGRANRTIVLKIPVSEKILEFYLDKTSAKTGMRTRMLAGLWSLPSA